jgi:hypothetical protein
MTKKDLYIKAYHLLEQVTPLTFDCGTICGRACCHGDEESGMYLFPSEEELLRSSGFLCLTPTDLKHKDGRPVLLAICPGECERIYRPLSCRIFPLTPYLDMEGKLTVKMDPRAHTLCPLARNVLMEELNPKFIKAVYIISGLLLRDLEAKGFIEVLSRLLDEYENPDFLGLFPK